MAKSENKPIFLEFYTTWCPPCNQLARDVFPDPEVQKKLDRFVFARYDSETDVGWPLHQNFRVRNWPTMIFLDPSGAEIQRYLGFQDAKGLVPYLDQILSKAHPQTASPPPAGDAAALYEHLDQASKRGDEIQTLRYLKDLKKLDPDNRKGYLAQGFFSLAELKRGRLEYESAAGLLEKIANQYPQSPAVENAAYLLATNYQRAGLEKAIRVYREMIKKYPQKAFWYDAYADLCGFYRYRMAEGFKMAQKAIELDPKNADYHATLAQLYHTKKDFARAAEEMTTAADLNPKEEGYRNKLLLYRAELSVSGKTEGN